jgi:Tol biopolymer transport system component
MKTRHVGLIGAALLTVFLAAFLAAGQKNDQAELALKAAIKTETVDGNLKGAIEQYKKIAAQPGAGRATVATALLRMGQCYEKMGNAEARTAYERLVREFGDQAEQAQAARVRLAALAGTPSRTAGTEMTIRRVLSGAEVDSTGSPSPDGRYLSIMDSESGGDLAIWEIASGQKRRLTNKDRSTAEGVLASKWSPDGKKIAYCWLKKELTGELRIIGSDGSEPRILPPVWPLDWSPDGRSILAYVPRNNANPERMVRVSVADGSLTTLGTAEKPISSRTASYSADGKYIVYHAPQQDGSPERDIFIVSIDGKQGIPLVKHPADDQLLGWVPGSDTVLFASDRTGTKDAWALHVVDGKPQGEPVLVRNDIGQISPMGFSNGGSFYYSLGVSVVDVFEGSLDLAKGTVVAPPKKIIQLVAGTNYSAEWSPDGKYLAYVSERKAGSASQSSYILCIRSDQTGEEREVPLPIESFWKMHWSADSRAVFAAMYDKTNQGLFKIDIQTGQQTLLARSGWSESLIKDFAVSPDGKSVYYAHFQWTKKLVTIIRHDLETGQEKEIYRKAAPPDIDAVTVSPDGKYLSFSTADNVAKQRFVIRIMPTAGGETRDLLQGILETFANHAWTPDGKAILFIKRTSSTKDEKRELWQVDSAGGEPKKINVGMELREMQLHPDGRRIVFTSGKTSREIWVMENFLPATKAAK